MGSADGPTELAPGAEVGDSRAARRLADDHEEHDDSGRAVHYVIGERHRFGYACGVGRRWGSQTITGTRSRAAVTCGGCERTHAYTRST